MEPLTPPATDRLPSVSVIVPCYRSGVRSERLVSALAQQDLSAELLFVDDGSGDGTADTLRALTAVLPNARVLAHRTNRGRAAARNTGIEAASGEILLFLDADMVPEPAFVRAHAEAHRREDLVGVVSTPRLRGIDPDNLYHQYLLTQRSAAAGHDGPIPFRAFIIGYTSVKAHAIETIGGFDERFTYGEDIDLAYRLWQRFPSGLVRSRRALVDHYGHGSLDERLDKLREFGSRNLPLLLDKHPDIGSPANLDFARPSTLSGWTRWAALRCAPRKLLQLTIHRIPRHLRFVALRYLMAATVANAFREA